VLNISQNAQTCARHVQLNGYFDKLTERCCMSG